MKVLLTHAYFICNDPVEQTIMKPYPPLGLLYVSSYLKSKGFEVKVLDSTFMTIESWKEEVLNYQPDVLCAYANLITKPLNLQLMAFAKSQLPQLVTIAGGPDVTYNAENYLKHGFDYLVIGEGEQTSAELCSAIQFKTPVDDIAGIAYLKNDELVKTSARTKIKDMDTLPLPDREAIDLNKYLDTWQLYHGVRMLNVSTQRGCPYTCKWCSTAVYGQSYRRRPANLVADEIEYLIDGYKVDGLWFVDDVFTVSHKWIQSLYDEFVKRQLKIKFECISRAERLNDEVLKQLSEMGCTRIWIGAESGSQKIINAMDRKVEVDKVREMINRTKSHGIEAGTFIMVGYPGETLEDIKETVYHLKVATPNQLTITKAYPIKGTELYDEIEKDITTHLDWHTSTDRQIDFKRNYSPKFYEYAIRYVVNSNLSFQAKEKKATWQFLKSFGKAKMSYALMLLNK